MVLGAKLWIKYERQSLKIFFYWKMLWRAFFSLWSQILQSLHSKYFFPNWAIDGAHHWFDKNWLGRHKRDFLRTHRTSCCFCSFCTIWILTLFNVRLSRLREVRKFKNDWSSINFHYLGPQKAQLVDTKFKIQVTRGVQNIQTRVGTPCRLGRFGHVHCRAWFLVPGHKLTTVYSTCNL